MRIPAKQHALGVNFNEEPPQKCLADMNPHLKDVHQRGQTLTFMPNFFLRSGCGLSIGRHRVPPSWDRSAMKQISLDGYFVLLPTVQGILKTYYWHPFGNFSHDPFQQTKTKPAFFGGSVQVDKTCVPFGSIASVPR